jgi:hypothetical protein
VPLGIGAAAAVVAHVGVQEPSRTDRAATAPSRGCGQALWDDQGGYRCRPGCRGGHSLRTARTERCGEDDAVRGRYDGEYDKTNLPDELILTNYFTVRDGKIVRLIVIRNTPAY